MHNLIANAVLPIKDGGLKGRVYFLSSYGPFLPLNIRPKLLRYYDTRQEYKEILRTRIFSGQLYHCFAQEWLVEELFELVITKDIKLIILDGVIRTYNHEHTDMTKRHIAILNHMTKLQKIAKENGIILCVTNEIRTELTTGKDIPSGGCAMAAMSSVRVQLMINGIGEYFAKLTDAHYTPNLTKLEQNSYLGKNTVKFQMDNYGISEIKDFGSKNYEF